MKLIFLDRDGVISIFTPQDYVKSWGEFQFIDGAIDGLKKLYSNGYKLVIISNQAGLNRGLFSQEDLDDITKRMKDVLKKEDVELTGTYYCRHTPEENCDCRKPKTGLFKQAEQDIKGINYAEAYFIGDSDIDIIAGKSIGVKTVLVLTGKTKTRDEVNNWQIKPDFIFEDLKTAAEFITKGNKNEKI